MVTHAFNIENSMSMLVQKSQDHKKAKDHKMMIRDYAWLMISKRLCMTRSSTHEQLTPFKEPEQEFQPSRKLFKTLTLNESRSHEYNLFSNLEENSEEEELRDNTFSGSDHEDANEHIEKVLETVNLFNVPNITQDQIMLQVFPMSLTGAARRWLRNKLSGSIKTSEDLKTKFLSKTRSTKTSDGLDTIQAQLNNLGREIKKVNEKVYAAQVGCEQCKGPH
ncbi:hypothetical protein Tco_0713161 [Tanacetum coccineum]